MDVRVGLGVEISVLGNTFPEFQEGLEGVKRVVVVIHYLDLAWMLTYEDEFQTESRQLKVNAACMLLF